MVDLSRDASGRTRARLLDLVPGRSGAAYADWLKARDDAFRAGIGVATLDPFHGYKNAIDDQLDDAVAVLDAFHVVKLGTDAVDQVRRRVQQTIHGHRGRKGDPLYGIRTDPALRPGTAHRQTESTPGAGDRRRRTPRRGPRRLAGRSTAPRRLPRRQSRRRPPDRREDPGVVPVLPDPRDRPARPDTAPVASSVPGLLHHRPRLQRRHRSDQRTDRAPPPDRPRLHQPRELPTTHAPHRRRTRPNPPQVRRAAKPHEPAARSATRSSILERDNARGTSGDRYG